MKLLTLEEIEKAEQAMAGQIGWRDGELFESLLATARAYCEMMDKLKKNIPMLRQWLNEDRKASPLVHSHDIAQWLEVPMEFKGYMSIADEQKINDMNEKSGSVAMMWPKLKKGIKIRTNAYGIDKSHKFTGEVAWVDEERALLTNGNGDRYVYKDNCRLDTYIAIL